MCVSSMQHNDYIICIQVQSSFNDYDIACKLVRFLLIPVVLSTVIQGWKDYIVTDDVQALFQMI